MQDAARILITGGAGYIGSHTVVELQRHGYQVVVVDNLSNSQIEVLDGIHSITGMRPQFRQVDICDEHALETVMKADGPFDGVIHFAAFKAVGESVQQPLRYYRNNIGGLVTLAGLCHKYKVDRFIFSSSCTVYGQPAELPVTEDAPIQPPASPYGHTKQIGESILQDCIGAGDFRQVISLRYFNPVGAEASAHIGELPIGVPANLMPFITQTAIGKRARLQVFGSDYATPDGTAIRDYIHVMDLAAAHRVALERLLETKNDSPYEVFNIGAGRGYSVLEVIRAFEEVSGQTLPWAYAPRRPGDVEQVWADTSRAAEVLGWRAKYTLHDMVQSAWHWELALAGHTP
jgi:UDP-glucose 4-epimerase